MSNKNEKRINDNKYSDRMAQRDMHKNFFDRCQIALDNGFYMEAIFMEYAAIEARLEVILGILGLPCNQFISDNERRSINISCRINCLKEFVKTSKVFEKSKLTNKELSNIESWIGFRNQCVHGLYKNEIRYKTRMKDTKQRAEKGLELSRLLYDEAGRLRRIYKKENAIYRTEITCKSDRCLLFNK